MDECLLGCFLFVRQLPICFAVALVSVSRLRAYASSDLCAAGAGSCCSSRFDVGTVMVQASPHNLPEESPKRDSPTARKVRFRSFMVDDLL
jgi:hypothetical protein